MKYFLHNIFFIFIIISFNCQSENTNYYDNLKFNHFTEKDGLNSSTLDQIYQDSIGYIWVATNRALLRYNGEKFQNLTEKGNKFFKENTYNIKSITNKNYLQNCYVDNNNNVWIMSSKDYINQKEKMVKL